ncbi:HD domain-containing protein [Nannocystis punicea]|uniref:ATP-binding protein n=1 Tax=Nannocystis punicea TaxID=2995304 RepID=A0ABY7H739_9BACT|nr:ATP-binding protein [Nannocystis poenicansa]WAS95086.1 ATP-binding protein [Nannocystis poenicansa]
MFIQSLTDVKLFKSLQARTDPVSTTLAGALIPLLNDSTLYCQQTSAQKQQHAWQILERISQFASSTVISQLSSLEIFILILSASLHEREGTGQDGCAATPDGAQDLAGDLKTRLAFMAQHASRIATTVQAVVHAHGLDWDENRSNKRFLTPDMIGDQKVRVHVLVTYLRIADLLDLESDRSCKLARRCMTVSARPDHCMQGLGGSASSRIINQYVDPEIIRVVVENDSRVEYHRWHQWLSHLRQEIERANTYMFVGDFQDFRLPPPDEVKVLRSSQATYEVWGLKFEIDQTGRIWDLISRSVYTGRWDFIRELLQNAIDATALRLFLDSGASVAFESPRGWKPSASYTPRVTITSSANGMSLAIFDNGIGMTRSDLENFLFTVADSGYSKRPTGRSFRFHSIARFGIGFISILTRARTVLIRTRPHDGSDLGRRVFLEAGSREAYAEIDAEAPIGTSISLTLKDPISFHELETYFKREFRFVSAPVRWISWDAVSAGVKFARSIEVEINPRLEHDLTKVVGTTGDQAIIEKMLHEFTEVHQTVLERLRRTTPNRRAPRWPAYDVPLLFPSGTALPGALVVVLDEYFNISQIHQASHFSGSKKRLIVWVPCHLVDLNAGIEWSSMHGFLVENGHAVTSITSAPKAHEVLGDELYNEDLALQNRLMQERDLYALEDEDGSSDAATATSLTMGEDQITIASLEGGEVFESRDMFSGLEAKMVMRSAMSGLRKKGGAKDVRLESLFNQLVTALQSLDNSAFQDGVRLPIAANHVAPIGACRALMNLSAVSRLPLNASRSSIDESPTLLNQWAGAGGRYVQGRILEEIERVLRHLGIVWEEAGIIRAGVFSSVTSELERHTRRTIRHAINDIRSRLNEEA